VRYVEHAPAVALEPFVACFWAITGAAGPQRVLPDGAMDLIFARGDAVASVIGPMTRAIVTPASGDARAWIVGARFRPGAATAMLGIAARELRDEAASAVDVWGGQGRALGAKLGEARAPREAIAVLAAELVSRVARAGAPDARIGRTVETLRAARGELPVPAVAASVGLGERQLERLFHELIGYGPKAFARIVRLQRATQSIDAALRGHGRELGTIASWARFARDCGYGDQAHLIREFRALAGVTPRLYARARVMSEIDNPIGAPLATFRA
jgi:AraC-like DNA-binding protein